MCYKSFMTPVPRIGTDVAGYRIEGRLGQGGMGVVYRAEHPRVGATVAIKVMDPTLGTDEAFRERFVRESRLAARIRHPNIIPIYDAGEWQGDLYIAMRYVEGDDLRSILRREGALPIERACTIGAQIASALDAAHRVGLVHRDVKPANILVESGPDPDSSPIAYLVDFGLTKHVDSHSGVTGSGELLGTIDYIAPEQVSGGRVDGRADVYSLACVLFECLTGAVPYVRENQAAVLWAHLHDDPPRATAMNTALPSLVDAALARGMAKSPEDRFSTCRELVAAVREPLEAATGARRDGLESRPTEVSRPTAQVAVPPAAAPRGAKRGLALAAVVGALLGGTGAAAVLLLVPNGDSAAPRAAAEAPPTTTATQEPTSTTFTPFEAALLEYIPDEIRDSCSPAPPRTPDFDATVSCRPGGVVDAVTYSRARSGVYLFRFLRDRARMVGLRPSRPRRRAAAYEVPLRGRCSGDDLPSLSKTVATGLSGRRETRQRLGPNEHLGWVLCHQRGQRARIEWFTREVPIHAIAVGKDLPPLYAWWRRHAGPEP